MVPCVRYVIDLIYCSIVVIVILKYKNDYWSNGIPNWILKLWSLSKSFSEWKWGRNPTFCVRSLDCKKSMTEVSVLRIGFKKGEVKNQIPNCLSAIHILIYTKSDCWIFLIDYLGLFLVNNDGIKNMWHHSNKLINVVSDTS